MTYALMSEGIVADEKEYSFSGENSCSIANMAKTEKGISNI
jgi:hypothetical protein